MKPTKYILLVLFMLVFTVGAADAQSERQQDTHSKQLAELDSLSYCWRLLSPLGLRELAPMDTIPLNYHRQAIPSFASNAWATTGNLGAEGMNMIFYQRDPISDFFFRDALTHWMPTHDKMRFYNTRVPFTLVDFNTAGGRENAQDHLQMKFSGNINSKAQVGAMLDYLYSKGCYNYQATKDLSWGFNGSYIGDRYELQVYDNHNNCGLGKRRHQGHALYHGSCRDPGWCDESGCKDDSDKSDGCAHASSRRRAIYQQPL